MTKNILRKLYFLTFSLLFLACGGGGGGDPAPGPTVSKSANIALSETSHNYYGIVVNNTADRTFVITNAGDADLSIEQISAPSSPFSLSVDACSNTTLAPSQSCVLRSRFAPANEGTFNSEISIPSNDPDTGSAKIALSGRGYGLNVWINSISGNTSCNVGIIVTVIDYQGNSLMSLAKNNLNIAFNDREVADFTLSANQYPLPVSLVLALDWSPSTRGVINDVKTGSANFIDQLNAGGGEAAICKFNSQIGFYPAAPVMFNDLVTHAADLKSSINASFAEVDGTALYDAIYDAVTRAASGANSKKAVVILSDGVDAHSNNHSFADVANHAIQQGIPLFTIYYRDPSYSDGTYGNPDIMRLLAQTTGGQFYDGTTSSLNLTQIYQRIANTLSNSYTIEFTAESCPAGAAFIDVSVSAGGLTGKDSSSVIFP